MRQIAAPQTAQSIHRILADSELTGTVLLTGLIIIILKISTVQLFSAKSSVPHLSFELAQEDYSGQYGLPLPVAVLIDNASPSNGCAGFQIFLVHYSRN